jgi:hypothetical protein
MNIQPLSFCKGGKYRVVGDYSELGHCFTRGQVVEFIEDAYDPRLGVHRYWFRNEQDEIIAWHLWDSGEGRPPQVFDSMNSTPAE